MNRKVFILCSALALVASGAGAADLPLPILKAPAQVGYPTGRGCYAGLGAAAEVAKASVNSVDTGGTSLYGAGAAIDVAFGCSFSIIGTWAAIEGDASYTNLGGTQLCAAGVACTIGKTWGFSQGVLVGFPWTNIMGYLPGLGSWFGSGPPALPGGVTATSSKPYIGAWLHEDDVSASINLTAGRAWQLTPSIGIGAINWIACDTCTAKGLVLDTRIEYEFNNSSFGVGLGGAATRGSAVITKAIFKY